MYISNCLFSNPSAFKAQVQKDPKIESMDVTITVE